MDVETRLVFSQVNYIVGRQGGWGGAIFGVDVVTRGVDTFSLS